MNKDLEKKWKGKSWPDLRYYPGICLDELKRKTLVRRVGLRAEI
jgi:hypothetical protein